MVTNLTQEAKSKWAEAIAAKEPETKLRLLREFYSVMPKHKSTEKLELSIKRQISSLQQEVERKRTRKTGSTKLEWTVKKEEELQLALVGRLQPAVRVFNTLTGLRINVYHALMKPVIGSFKALNIRSQIVLTPMDESIGEDKRDKFVSVSRNTDALIVVVDETNYIKTVTSWFEERNIDIISSRPKVELEYAPHGGIRIVGRSEYIGDRETFDFLKSFNIKHAVVKLSNDATMNDVEDAIFGRATKKCVFVVLKDLYTPVGNSLKFYADNKEKFMQDLLKSLGLLRIFTKKIGGEPGNDPLLMNNGSKVIDLAYRIHKDFARNFKFARIWRDGSSVKVGKYFLLKDFDVIEIHL
ncbi:MAG: TGS domain-containing protein [Nitrososphaerales archaeon]